MQQPSAAPADLRDKDIVGLLQDGEQAVAFDELVKRYERKIYRLCCGLLRDPVHAQDAAQESLLRIWNALGRYDGRASLSTWIYTITRNRCLTALERRRGDDQDPAATETDDGQQWIDEAAAPDPGGNDDRAALLRSLVDSLPERHRRALTLYYFEERSVTEAADMLGVPEGTLKTNLFRARALLLERIAALGLADPLEWLQGL